MKLLNLFSVLFFLGLFFNPSINFAQNEKGEVPWTNEQEMQPADLAAIIASDKAADVLIINAGPVDNIKGAVKVDALTKEENIQKLEVVLKDVSKDKEIVIYCGCCPMNVCPNIRPAYSFLADNGFQNFKILDVKQNIGTDWIGKGYPTDEE